MSQHRKPRQTPNYLLLVLQSIGIAFLSAVGLAAVLAEAIFIFFCIPLSIYLSVK